jgi:gliding motility-associated-like protein
MGYKPPIRRCVLCGVGSLDAIARPPPPRFVRVFFFPPLPKTASALILGLLLVFAVPAKAAHLIGGDLSYTHLGGTSYQLRLELYRDCATAGALFDDPVYIFIYEASSGNLDRIQTVNLGAVTIVTQNVTLPPLPGGYFLVYQRCCRNPTIINLFDPGDTGSTYVSFVPDPGSTTNSSPRFNDQPPLILCRDEALVFDHSATDLDGDALVYSLCAPNSGATPGCPRPAGIATPVGCPTEPGPPPYSPVDYWPPFSAGYPMDASPALAIDPSTGLLTGTPLVEGQYVVGICVDEYRGGVLLSTQTRDFQFNVVNCDPSIEAATTDNIVNCNDYAVTFPNLSSGASSYFWDFGVGGATSTATTPTFTFPDTGRYTITLIAEPGIPCTDTFVTEVAIYPGMEADFDADPACPDNPTAFTDLSSTAFGVINSWRWSFGDGALSNLPNPSRSYGSGGTYAIEFIARTDLGCADTAYGSVDIPYAPELNPDIGLACLDVPTSFSDASTLVGGSVVDRQWDFADGGTASGTPVLHTFNAPGLYPVELVVTGDNGCISDTVLEVNINPLVQAEAMPGDTICEDDRFPLFASGGSAFDGLSFQWSPEGSLDDPNSANPLAAPTTTTTYTVSVSDACSEDTASVTVYVLPAPNAQAWPQDTTIVSGASVQLDASGGVTYTWTPPDSLSDPLVANPVATPSFSQYFTVWVQGANGCGRADSVLIQVQPRCEGFVMPNAFTPDGDGRNDRFRAVRKGDDTFVRLSVFNRWGERLFLSDQEQLGWDGTVAGRPQESGVYIYLLQSVCGSGADRRTGTLTLIR